MRLLPVLQRQKGRLIFHAELSIPPGLHPHISPVRLDLVILTPSLLVEAEVVVIVLETSNSGFKRNVTSVSRVRQY